MNISPKEKKYQVEKYFKSEGETKLEEKTTFDTSVEKVEETPETFLGCSGHHKLFNKVSAYGI